LDLGNIKIRVINISTKTLEAMLKTLYDLQEVQDTMEIKPRRKDVKERRRTMGEDNHQRSLVVPEACHWSLGSTQCSL
jgi:hypothetical protein